MFSTKFYLIGYESLLQELERIRMLLDLKRFAVVLDESHKIKNPNARTTQALFEIKDLSAKKVIISGSPLANRPEDLWSQFFFLDNGALLGANYNDLKKRFNVNLREASNLESYQEFLRELRQKISNVSIRRTKDVLELPEKTYYDLSVDLVGKQKVIYDRALREMIIEIQEADGTVIIDQIENYLVKLLRLTQIASNPKLIDESYDECPAKFKKIDQLVNEIIAKGEKVIIWTSFRDNVRTLRKRYATEGAVMLFGEMTTEEKNVSVDKFQESNDCKVLIANPSVAGVGLTLTSANNAIYLDRNFKMDDYIQSQDRIHRIGQVKRCNLYKIIAKGTIDEYTDEIIEKKFLIAQFCLSDRDTLKVDKPFMTKEDILKILGG